MDSQCPQILRRAQNIQPFEWIEIEESIRALPIDGKHRLRFIFAMRTGRQRLAQWEGARSHSTPLTDAYFSHLHDWVVRFLYSSQDPEIKPLIVRLLSSDAESSERLSFLSQVKLGWFYPGVGLSPVTPFKRPLGQQEVRFIEYVNRVIQGGVLSMDEIREIGVSLRDSSRYGNLAGLVNDALREKAKNGGSFWADQDLSNRFALLAAMASDQKHAQARREFEATLYSWISRIP